MAYTEKVNIRRRLSGTFKFSGLGWSKPEDVEKARQMEERMMLEKEKARKIAKKKAKHEAKERERLGLEAYFEEKRRKYFRERDAEIERQRLAKEAAEKEKAHQEKMRREERLRRRKEREEAKREETGESEGEHSENDVLNDDEQQDLTLLGEKVGQLKSMLLYAGERDDIKEGNIAKKIADLKQKHVQQDSEDGETSVGELALLESVLADAIEERDREKEGRRIARMKKGGNSQQSSDGSSMGDIEYLEDRIKIIKYATEEQKVAKEMAEDLKQLLENKAAELGKEGEMRGSEELNAILGWTGHMTDESLFLDGLDALENLIEEKRTSRDKQKEFRRKKRIEWGEESIESSDGSSLDEIRDLEDHLNKFERWLENQDNWKKVIEKLNQNIENVETVLDETEKIKEELLTFNDAPEMQTDTQEVDVTKEDMSEFETPTSTKIDVSKKDVSEFETPSFTKIDVSKEYMSEFETPSSANIDVNKEDMSEFETLASTKISSTFFSDVKQKKSIGKLSELIEASKGTKGSKDISTGSQPTSEAVRNSIFGSLGKESGRRREKIVRKTGEKIGEEDDITGASIKSFATDTSDTSHGRTRPYYTSSRGKHTPEVGTIQKIFNWVKGNVINTEPNMSCSESGSESCSCTCSSERGSKFQTIGNHSPKARKSLDGESPSGTSDSCSTEVGIIRKVINWVKENIVGSENILSCSESESEGSEKSESGTNSECSTTESCASNTDGSSSLTLIKRGDHRPNRGTVVYDIIVNSVIVRKIRDTISLASQVALERIVRPLRYRFITAIVGEDLDSYFCNLNTKDNTGEVSKRRGSSISSKTQKNGENDAREKLNAGDYECRDAVNDDKHVLRSERGLSNQTSIAFTTPAARDKLCAWWYSPPCKDKKTPCVKIPVEQFIPNILICTDAKDQHVSSRHICGIHNSCVACSRGSPSREACIIM